MKRINAISFTATLAAALFLSLAACNSQNQPTAQNQAGDPANGNLAPASAEPPQAAAPVYPAGYANGSQNGLPNTAPDTESYGEPDASSYAQPIEASQPPPPLPQYTQPACPGENYLWTPGYWSYADSGYYWVPGAWVIAPYVGALWTPPYWDYSDGYYRWHRGYWASHIGFYGGIDYGFGYTGRGYYGAYWNRGVVNYNRSVTNVNTTSVHNVYNYPVSNNNRNRVSYNGGRGGINARPSAPELAVQREQRTPPVAAQIQHVREAATNRAQFAAVNRERPAMLATARPLATTYKTPAPRPPVEAPRQTAAPNAPRINANRRPEEARPESVTRAQVQPTTRPEMRPMPSQRLNERPTERMAPQAAPAPRTPLQENRPVPRAQPTPPSGLENRRVPVAPARPQPSRDQPNLRQEARPVPQQRLAPNPRIENRPAPVGRPPAPEARPAAPAPRPQENRPAARQVSKPAPQQPRPEDHVDHRKP